MLSLREIISKLKKSEKNAREANKCFSHISYRHDKKVETNKAKKCENFSQNISGFVSFRLTAKKLLEANLVHSNNEMPSPCSL
jgi:hypothetical protein